MVGIIKAYPPSRAMPGPALNVCQRCGGYTIGIGGFTEGPAPMPDIGWTDNLTVRAGAPH